LLVGRRRPSIRVLPPRAVGRNTGRAQAWIAKNAAELKEQVGMYRAYFVCCVSQSIVIKFGEINANDKQTKLLKLLWLSSKRTVTTKRAQRTSGTRSFPPSCLIFVSSFLRDFICLKLILDHGRV